MGIESGTDDRDLHVSKYVDDTGLQPTADFGASASTFSPSRWTGQASKIYSMGTLRLCPAAVIPPMRISTAKTSEKTSACAR